MRPLAALALVALVLIAACARPAARSGTGATGSLAGCDAALSERGVGLAAIDQATQQAAGRNPGRADQLRGIGAQAKQEIASAADLGPCDARSATTGVSVDVADLRARFDVVRERTQRQLDATAAQPAPKPVVQPVRPDTKHGGRGKD